MLSGQTHSLFAAVLTHSSTYLMKRGQVERIITDPMRRRSGTLSRWRTGWLFVAGVLMIGCQASSSTRPAPGGDSPVTPQRLSGARLTDIHQPLSWTFDSATVSVDYESQPIPADVVELLLGEHAAAERVEATWRLDPESGTLHLTNMKADGESIDRVVEIPIAPAGHVRVNLGSRQYNLFRDVATMP